MTLLDALRAAVTWLVLVILGVLLLSFAGGIGPVELTVIVFGAALVVAVLASRRKRRAHG